MTIGNWQYDNLKETLNALIEDEGTPNRDVLWHCRAHFERFEKWMARWQEAFWYEENECKHRGRLLEKIKRIIEEDKYDL